MDLRRLRRQPTVRWGAAIALALVTGVTVHTTLGAADAARRSWGLERPVAVATHAIAAGSVVGPDDVEQRMWPEAVVPPGALAAPPVGRTARADIAAGEAVIAERVAGDGLSGAAALTPPGWRTVAIAQGPATLSVEPGATVDLYVTADPGSGAGRAILVADDVVVAAVDERTVTVAVPAALVGDVASAATTGTVTLAGHP
ncbi:MAG: SAF domain-containing protein [Acidimicrobiales bacterium]